MNQEIAAVYTDKHGSIHTSIINDAETLTITLDGIIFSGDTFVFFQPAANLPLPGRFSLGQLGQLTDFTLSCRIPIPTWKGGTAIQAFLLLEVDYSEDALLPSYSSPYFHFRFEMDNEIIEVGKLQQFEGVFERLQEKLPGNIVIKTCYTCQYSDYSVYGSDVFGDMLCFRNVKDSYTKVRDKSEYMDMMDDFERMVQETYLCEDFSPRIKGTGYRG
ncbi:DUF6304 family protein [Chitinophaga filiformis]|uniref:DUF6304 family protein n=1 Tax=Chitinophaga filiformis TaxID=104663 RepID=A0ABY4I0B9_CHIFI|nr:DUF6304 family protein [Chitinophaga filiformis]UPK69514.1 DUF6304 family protein [Chitinophaga filiformis]